MVVVTQGAHTMLPWWELMVDLQAKDLCYEMEWFAQWWCEWVWWKYLDQQIDFEETWDEKSQSGGKIGN